MLLLTTFGFSSINGDPCAIDAVHRVGRADSVLMIALNNGSGPIRVASVARIVLDISLSVLNP